MSPRCIAWEPLAMLGSGLQGWLDNVAALPHAIDHSFGFSLLQSTFRLSAFQVQMGFSFNNAHQIK